jgi:hypothetical protein
MAGTTGIALQRALVLATELIRLLAADRLEQDIFVVLCVRLRACGYVQGGELRCEWRQ